MNSAYRDRVKLLLGLLFTLSSLGLLGQSTVNVQDVHILEELSGDLDSDGIAEKIVVYDTGEQTEDGTLRELIIFKKQSGEWHEWHKSRSAVLPSKYGGMMGDPFEGISLENGILQIHFFGGSSWKWSYTDKYRFQNNRLVLIGFTHHYFRLCHYWDTDDFNLSTGKIISKREYERCDDGEQIIYKKEEETFYKKGLTITLQNRNEKEIKIVTPRYGKEIYLDWRS